MHERIRQINHHGKQVLVVDLSNCSAVEVAKILRAVPELVTTRPSENLKKFSRREFPTFKTREEALTWLAKD
jgi:hypothetical protein